MATREAELRLKPTMGDQGRRALERLKDEGIELAKKQLQIAAPIKELGPHMVTIKLHADIETELKLEVVSENPIEESADSEEEITEDDE